MSGTVAGPEVLTFRLPSPPPSMNSLYSINYRRREVFMKPEVRSYKTSMKFCTPTWDVKPDDMIDATFELIGAWMCKNGNIKKADVQNTVKVLIDLISEKQGWNDCQVWKFSAVKRHSESESCVNVTLRKLVTEPGAAKSASQEH